jgi:hypothetical protein
MGKGAHHEGTKDRKVSDRFNSELRALRTTFRYSLSDLRKFLDAPNPRGRVLNPPLRLPIFFAPFAFLAAILLFGCGSAALCLRGEIEFVYR